jgi:hypothetical protein
LIKRADHGEKEDNTEDCGEEGGTSKADAEGRFGGWGTGRRRGGAGDEITAHLSSTSVVNLSRGMVTLRLISGFTIA